MAEFVTDHPSQHPELAQLLVGSGGRGGGGELGTEMASETKNSASGVHLGVAEYKVQVGAGV